MANLQMRNVRKSYGAVEIIKGVDLDIKDREFCVFVGPSGCGKSTLLRMVAGLEEITAGDLTIDGKRVNDVAPADRGLAMVFQSYALYPHMTVRDNMAFALKLSKVDKAERDAKVAEASRILQLDKYLERRPKELSGGQRQRVAIGRAIVRSPKIFLFDEPLSNLDAALRGQMRVELARLHQDLKATMIYVTHDQVEAMTMADRIVVLQGGYVEQVGSPLELYHHPANQFVAGFIGSPRMNFLAGKVETVDGNAVSVIANGSKPIPVAVEAGGVSPGASVTLGIRPEAMRPDPNGAISGEIRHVERLGGVTLIHFAPQGAEEAIIAQVDGAAPARLGEQITLGVDPEGCHLFGTDGKALPRRVRHPLAA